MMIELIKPFSGSTGRDHDWLPGDRISHLDGQPIADILDFYYYVPAGDTMELTVARADGDTVTVVLPTASLDRITDAFAPLEFRTCACNCVFCFIDQNPSGLRPSLYVKDEDYRFSFLYGNYVTLTSLGRRGLARMIEQRMTPLYVSVHATDIDVRTRLLGIKRRIDVVQIMRALVENGIELHTQVVLCPGWNDGAVLEQTYGDLRALATRGAGVQSLAIVPVGLSAHRDGLTRLAPVTAEIARRVIARAADWQRECRAELDRSFIYLSDELYLLAGAPFPAAALYDDFPQLDNGIGLTSSLRQRWLADFAARTRRGAAPRRELTVLTSVLAAQAFARELVPPLVAAGAPSLDVIGVENTFYGRSVTVAGLLSGHDLSRALAALPPSPRRTVVLSPRVFNNDGLTLDDMTLDGIAAAHPHAVVVAEEDGFVDFWADLP